MSNIQCVRGCTTLALCTLLASCASLGDVGEEGRYVAFVRDIMAESARLQEEAKVAKRSEQAVDAVKSWRGADAGAGS